MNSKIYHIIILFAIICSCSGTPRSLEDAGIVDAHMHLYDTSRPQGVSWPSKKENPKIYRPFLSKDYLASSKPLGIQQSVLVLTGDWYSDNQWNLDEIKNHKKAFPAFIGYIDINDQGFKKKIAPLLDHPQFKGIRIIHKSPEKTINQRMYDNIKFLGEKNKVLEILMVFYKPDDVISIAQKNPNLPIVLSGFRCKNEEKIKIMSSLKNIHVKMSVGNDRVWNYFGEDRLLYGSDWPNLYQHLSGIEERLKPFKKYLNNKGAEAKRKVLRGNAERVYSF